MLRELSIKNFAIIDDLRIRFSSGLTILSGETGAGKSIIINAVNLLLGSRAASDLIRTGAETAELEALFHIDPKSRAARVMDDQGLDTVDGLVVRRVISRKNRHKTYINGRLATVQALSGITEHLASISGQHAHQGLLDEDHHLLVLDRFGGLMPLRRKMAKRYNTVCPMIQRLAGLEERKRRQGEQAELLQFQIREIDDAAPEPGEDGALEQEKKRLRHRAQLVRTVQESIEHLYAAPGAVVEQLVAASRSMEGAARIDTALAPRVADLSQAGLAVEECVEALRSYLGHIDLDGHRLEEVETRLDTINRLKRKYGGSLDDVLAHRAEMAAEQERMENLSEEMAALENDLAAKAERLAGTARDLSEKRKTAAAVLAKKVEGELKTLKMNRTAFEVDLPPLPADPKTGPYLTWDHRGIGETGADRARFLIAPNVGEALKPLAGIASGGELSRIVLALKAILARTESVETVVFDEVDAGIGGGVAEVVGKKLTALATHHQIICITHLSQIAKFGAHHYRIAKHVSRGRTRTTIAPLDNKGRLEEIARMLGGETITTATREHAREIMAQNSRD
jgi:DNA repair protein RecN (Recombination protein N)